MAGWLREAMMASNDTMSDCLKFLQDVIDTYSSGDAEYRSSLCRRGDAILLRLFATGTSQGTLDCLLPVIVSLRRRQEEEDGERYYLRTTCSGRGRPKFALTLEQLQYLLDHGFCVSEIDSLLGISRSTVHRRIAEFGIQGPREYSTIDDDELDGYVQGIQNAFPGCGEKLMEGHLAAQGLKVQRRRVRESIHRTDPVGVAIRRSLAILRRRYHVPHPNSLWHIDGNHKLIRYAISL